MMVLYDYLDPGDRDDNINIINGYLGTPGQWHKEDQGP